MHISKLNYFYTSEEVHLLHYLVLTNCKHFSFWQERNNKRDKNPIFANIVMKIVTPHVWSNNFEIIGRNYGNPIILLF